MAYSNRAEYIISIFHNEVNLAKVFGKKLVISVETGPTSEGDYVTFYQEEY